ncbi:hypothetical protein [Niallia sp. Krafla_26]|uniref:hypothetical protein n=1 Tax=Niallia sp. Krafla_26 TaxID=3064703 RepID=UPI003D1874E0
MSEVIKENKISVLIIEDEENQIQLINDAIDDFNDDNKENKISSDSVNNYNDGINILLQENFDAAIIDLNLDQTKTEPNDLDGNRIVDIIVNKFRIPIIIRTGYPTQFSSEKISEKNSFIKIYSKDESVELIIDQIVKWYTLGFSTTLGTKGILEQYLNELFWKHISDNFNEWDIEDISFSKQEKSLLRYIVNVLSNYLEIDGESGDFEFFHPAEVYIKPPVKNELFFGDILKDTQDNYYFILTPSCEMAQEKYKKILLSKILKQEEVEGFVRARDNYIEKPESQNKKSSLEKWFRNGHQESSGYHFLPPYSNFRGGFIDFQDILSVDPRADNFNFSKVATVTNQFAKDISSRFTSYYARQGQPNLNSQIIINSIKLETESV